MSKLTSWIPKWVKEQAKAVATFVVAFGTNMLVSLLEGETPLPTTKDQWIQYLLTSLGAALAAWGARNKITQKQIDRDPNVVGGVVVDTPPPAAPTPVGTATIDVRPNVLPGGGGGDYTNPFPEPNI